MDLYPPTRPVGLSDRVETSNFLAARIIFDEAYVAADVHPALFFRDLPFLLGDRLRTKATTIANDVFSLTEKGWVTMEIDSTILWLVPLGVQQ